MLEGAERRTSMCQAYYRTSYICERYIVSVSSNFLTQISCGIKTKCRKTRAMQRDFTIVDSLALRQCNTSLIPDTHSLKLLFLARYTPRSIHLCSKNNFCKTKGTSEATLYVVLAPPCYLFYNIPILIFRSIQMKSLLITGFDPFAHYIVNPSWKAVKALPGIVGDYQLHKLMLPNIFDLEAKILLEEAGRVKPDVILLCGMNSGSTRLQLNLAALNIRDAFLEDNLGHRPWGVPIREGAPDAYFATIPVHDMVRSLRAKHYPVDLALSSGGFVCNDIFYLTLHAFHDTDTKVGFVHVPLLPEMVMDESMALPLEKTTEVLQAIIKEL